jgi:photosystem II stability/assembly factor-like uncharacterized protein
MIARVIAAVAFVGCVAACSDGPFAIAPDTCTEETERGCWTLLGLEGMSVTAVEQTSEGVLVGTQSGRLFRLNDKGHWREIGAETWKDQLAPWSLLEVPSSPLTLLVGLRWSAPEAHARDDAVYASLDGGRTWHPSNTGLEGAPPSVSDMIVDPADPRRVFLASDQGVLRSLDSGDTWEFVLGGLDYLPAPYSVLHVHPERPGSVWLGGQTAGYAPLLLVSHDSGESWEGGFPRCNGQVPQDAVIDLAHDPVRSERLWIGMIDGILWSDSGRESIGEWRCEAVPRHRFVTGFAKLDDTFYAIANTYVRVYDEQGIPVDLHYHSGPLFRTWDGGLAWDSLQVPETLAPTSVRAVAVDSEGRVVMGTESGVWSFLPR